MSSRGRAPLGPVARLAGAVVDGLIGPSEVIGIAWGSTMAAVVREIPNRTATAIEVVQLAGSSRRLGRDEDAGALTRTLADRLGGLDHPLYAPAFVADPAVRDALVADPEVARTIERYRDLTLAIVGIGAMPAPGGEPSSSLLRSGALTTAEIDELAAGGAVGDLVVHPFDGDGRFVDTGSAPARRRHRHRSPAGHPARRRRRRRDGQGDRPSGRPCAAASSASSSPTGRRRGPCSRRRTTG